MGFCQTILEHFNSLVICELQVFLRACFLSKCYCTVGHKLINCVSQHFALRFLLLIAQCLAMQMFTLKLNAPLNKSTNAFPWAVQHTDWVLYISVPASPELSGNNNQRRSQKHNNVTSSNVDTPSLTFENDPLTNSVDPEFIWATTTVAVGDTAVLHCSFDAIFSQLRNGNVRISFLPLNHKWTAVVLTLL